MEKNTFYDTKNKSIEVTLKKAVTEGINPETGGIYMPRILPHLETSMKYRNPPPSFRELVLENTEKFCTDIPSSDLMSIIARFFPYTIPISPLDPSTYVIELFNGETCSFEDISAGFLTHILEFFASQEKKTFNIIIPSTGESGCALAHAIENVQGVKALILFPKGSLTEIQKKQLSLFSRNITAFSVNGSFQNCKQMVQEALLDKDLRNKIPLTSGDDSNFAVIIPKIACYIYGCLNAKHRSTYYNRMENPQVIVSECSQGYGNLLAGLIAKKRGTPIKGFLKAVIQETSESEIPDLSNSLNHFLNEDIKMRIDNLYESEELENNFIVYHTTPASAVNAMSNCNEKTGYVIDPVSAAAWQAWQKICGQNIKDENKSDAIGFFSNKSIEKWNKNCECQNNISLILHTSHPANSQHYLPRVLNRLITVPQRIAKLEFANGIKEIEIEADYKSLKSWLLSNYI